MLDHGCDFVVDLLLASKVVLGFSVVDAAYSVVKLEVGLGFVSIVEIVDSLGLILEQTLVFKAVCIAAALLLGVSAAKLLRFLVQIRQAGLLLIRNAGLLLRGGRKPGVALRVLKVNVDLLLFALVLVLEHFKLY